MRPQRVGIIGAGAVGIGCAAHLRLAGHDVTVLDPRVPGTAASLGNSGVIAVSEVLPLSRPSTLRALPRMLTSRTGPLVLRLAYLPQAAPWLVRFALACRPATSSRVSLALSRILPGAPEDWSRLVRGNPEAWRIRDGGWLRAFSTAAELNAAREMARRQAELGVAVEIVDRDGLADLEPALARVFTGASLCRAAVRIDMPDKLIGAVAAELAKTGVRFERVGVRLVQPDGRTVRACDELGRWHTFDKLVVAAGAWSRDFVRQLGADLPLDTERGYHVMLPTPPQTLRHAVTVHSPGYTLVQLEDGLRLATGIEFAGLAAAPDFRRVRTMAKHAATILPGLEASPKREWLGFRPSMPWSLPVIGPMRSCPQVLLACGHGHLGLTLGPTTGRIIAAQVAGLEPFLDPEPFLPRF